MDHYCLDSARVRAHVRGNERHGGAAVWVSGTVRSEPAVAILESRVESGAAHKARLRGAFRTCFGAEFGSRIGPTTKQQKERKRERKNDAIYVCLECVASTTHRQRIDIASTFTFMMIPMHHLIYPGLVATMSCVVSGIMSSNRIPTNPRSSSRSVTLPGLRPTPSGLTVTWASAHSAAFKGPSPPLATKKS
mmetsp:Transcript_16142/g.37186  ORF Transcript_16142/g.37186 Transcript_16142/m.37186 type:complete len:192 (-) Transcript_16142:564-1139(-)